MTATGSLSVRPPRRELSTGSVRLPKWPSWFLLIWWVLVLGIIRLPGIGRVNTSASAVQSGSLTRTILVLSFAAAGALMLPQAIKRLDRAGWRFLTFLVAYLGWASLSFVWSDAPQLTIRRLILATLLIVGALGLGAGYYGQSERGRAVFARDVLVAAMIGGVMAWTGALTSSGVDILRGDWSLVYTSYGTTIGYPLLLAGLISVYGRHTSAIANPFASRRTLGVILAGVLITIISLRKRAILAVTALATAALSFIFRRHSNRRAMVLRVGVGLSMVAMVVAVLGIDLVSTATPIVTRGDQELNLESLTGRVPLWEELIPRASENLWTGVGFGAFWTPDRMAEIQSAVRWPAVVAHNGYLDEILATGLPGLVLLFGAWATAIVALTRRARRGDSFALLSAVWMASYLLLNITGTVTQSNLFQFPFYSALVIAFAAFTTSPSGNVSSTAAKP